MKLTNLIPQSFARIILVPMLLSLPFSACTIGPKKIVDWPAEKGVVINPETGEPVSDVYIVGHWVGDTFGKTVCFHANGTTSDSKGRFAFPAWRNEGRFTRTTDPYFSTRPYKRGYKDVGGNVNRLQMVTFTGTREERFKYLKSLVPGSGCSSGGVSRKNLYPFFEAIYLEAKALAQSQEEIADLNWFRTVAASTAVARDGESDMSGSVAERLEKEFLKEHLK